jgi:hypothetical protein
LPPGRWSLRLRTLEREQTDGIERPRGPQDDRGGRYVDYDTYDESNPTGRNGQTGIRVVFDKDGNMITAYPWPHEIVR